MSQQVRIMKVTVRGAAPFLGLSAPEGSRPDDDRTPVWSRSPEQVMGWLCAAWRIRFNDHRSRRSKYGPDRTLVPLGSYVNSDTIAETRIVRSHLAAVPDLVLSSCEKIENGEWWAAIKRRKTLSGQGANPGAMPSFKSRKRHDASFACWFNGGKNARYQRVGCKSGIVTITGQNPTQWRQAGEGARFVVRIHVRHSAPIRDYTSVRVNWTRRELVFVNAPTPVAPDPDRAGRQVGIDVGCVHNLTTSDGVHHDLPRERLRELDRRVRFHQRRASKSRQRWVDGTGRPVREYPGSSRHDRHAAEVRRLRGRAARIVEDIQHKATTALVRTYDTIVVEDLRVAAMMRTPRTVADPLRPGHFLPNGAAAKRGLGRSLAQASLGRAVGMLEYKTTAAGTDLVRVPVPYTSQRCHVCGHIDPGNRESQAVFECRACGHRDNADINAAHNILWLHTDNNGAGLVLSVERAQHAASQHAGVGDAASKRKPPTVRAPARTHVGIPHL